jgi:hypothetical protein
MERKQRTRLYRAAALAGTAIAMLASMTATGCTTDAGGSLRIVQNQVPEAGCLIPVNANAPFRGRGLIDTQADDGYLFTPLVESLIAEPIGTQLARVVQVRGADVDVEIGSNLFSAAEEDGLRDDRLTRFSTAFSGSVFPEAETSFGFVVLPLALLDRIGDALGDGDSVTATVEVVIFGDLDGEDVESSPFVYPIDVCSGCMKRNVGDCAGLPDGFEPLQGGECNLLQDVRVECCTSGGAELCPAPT